ncbi:hypothetical protein I5L19_01800 [Serratia marcescens]|nr:hypothetical protein [Serratia marcescens]
MSIKHAGTEYQSMQDVIAYSSDPVFSHKEVVIDLPDAVKPGYILNASTGQLAVAGDTDVVISADDHEAGSAVHLIIVDRGNILKRGALKAADAAATTAQIAAIEKAGINRVSVN